MIERIHLDPKLKKCLAALKKGSSRAGLAAGRLETIVAEAECGRLPPAEMVTFTHNGEARIKGCRKYDLGGGYRLVTLKNGGDLFLLFAGNHEECSRWIENNRDQLPLEMITERCQTVERPASHGRAPTVASAQPDEEAETDWITPPDERDLRVVFSGLIGGKTG